MARLHDSSDESTTRSIGLISVQSYYDLQRCVHVYAYKWSQMCKICNKPYKLAKSVSIPDDVSLSLYDADKHMPVIEEYGICSPTCEEVQKINPLPYE